MVSITQPSLIANMLYVSWQDPLGGMGTIYSMEKYNGYCETEEEHDSHYRGFSPHPRFSCHEQQFGDTRPGASNVCQQEIQASRTP